eukprot:jgi/Psemu1/282921/fgenesh1_pg.16_\
MYGTHSSEHEHEHSPESAGLARGLARSAAHRGASRAAVGRLPLTNPKAPGGVRVGSGSGATGTSVARIRRVARVSDRAATGFDVVTEAHNATAAATTTPTTATSETQALARSRALAFAGGLVKNTILGAAVFAAYEGMLDWGNGFDDGKDECEEPQYSLASGVGTNGNGNDNGNGHGHEHEHEHGDATATTDPRPRDDDDVDVVGECGSSDSTPPGSGDAGTGTAAFTFAPAPALPLPLARHYGSGFCAGSVHAVLGRAIEGITTSTASILATTARATPAAPVTPVIQPAPLFLPYLLHHSVSHAVLFGSYETIKRGLLRSLLLSVEDDDKDDDNDNDEETGFERKLAAVALAGGTAGIGQQLVGDWTEGVASAVGAKGNSKNPGALRSAIVRVPGYSARTLGMASVPTAIGFVAFEYGREAVLGGGGGAGAGEEA